MDFFYLKLGNSNCLAEYWLEKEYNIFKKPYVAIYFGPHGVKTIKNLFKKMMVS